MTTYLLRRFANYSILTMLATLFAYIAASSFFYPRRRYLGQNPPIPEKSVDTLLDAVNMNDKVPVLERTFIWLRDIVTAPLGEKLGRDLGGNWVMEELFTRAGVSLRLLIIGALLGAIIGVSLGVWGAVRQYKFSDQVISYASFVLISTPTFVGGILLMVLATQFNQLMGTQIIRFSGSYTPSLQGTGFWSELSDAAIHLLLPTIALAAFSAASYSRYQRSIMLDVLGSDFIRTARAKGATRNRALLKHGVRVALIPMSTYFAYSFGTLVAGSAFLEIVFSWSGMGQYGINAVQQSDINALAGNVCFTAVVLLFSSMMSEVLYAALDPRVRV
ncbi:MAG: ABC transporter permease [Dermabacter sp.]|nr:ABC transporter permease [Dermabacter sp.]